MLKKREIRDTVRDVMIKDYSQRKEEFMKKLDKVEIFDENTDVELEQARFMTGNNGKQIITKLIQNQNLERIEEEEEENDCSDFS